MAQKKKKNPSQERDSKGPMTSYGAPADSVTVKTNINLNSIARQAAKRKTANLYSEDPVKLKEEQIKNRRKIIYNQINESDVISDKLETKDNEFVYYDGTKYEGLYHIHSDNTFMTEAIHIPGISKFIMKKAIYDLNRMISKSTYEKFKEAVPELVDPSR